MKIGEKIILILGILVIIFLIIGFTKGWSAWGLSSWEKNTIEESSREKALREFYYMESTMKIVNQTGLPEQYSCKEIKLRIETGVYPERKTIYDCKRNSEEEYTWCQTNYFHDNKESFVEYYILNCLYAFEVVDE